jgi:hypothetical protein
MRGARLGVMFALLFAGRPALAGVEAEVEGGVVFASRNDARIPGDGGTKISLVNDLSTSPSPGFRVRLGHRIADRHLVTALYAPLQLNARGSVDRDVSFFGGTYPAGSPLLAVYRFDSYRLTYRHSIVRKEGLDVAAGFTAKVRDAETSLYGVEARSKTNTGFVPLLNAHVEWRPGNGAFGIALDLDALAAPQGRAEGSPGTAALSLARVARAEQPRYSFSILTRPGREDLDVAARRYSRPRKAVQLHEHGALRRELHCGVVRRVLDSAPVMRAEILDFAGGEEVHGPAKALGPAVACFVLHDDRLVGPCFGRGRSSSECDRDQDAPHGPPAYGADPSGSTLQNPVRAGCLPL